MSTARQVPEKAARLLAEGRVDPDGLAARIFTVTGDNGTYRVVVGAHVRICTCPHGKRAIAGQVRGECSHIAAAVEWLLAEHDHGLGRDDQLETYERAFEERRERRRHEADHLFTRLERMGP